MGVFSNRITPPRLMISFCTVVTFTSRTSAFSSCAALAAMPLASPSAMKTGSMRRELFALPLPNPDRVQADYAVLSELSKGLSGGDILNICVNAIHAGSMDANPERWKVTQGMLEREIAKAKKAKAEHSGEKGKNRRMIGFQTS